MHRQCQRICTGSPERPPPKDEARVRCAGPEDHNGIPGANRSTLRQQVADAAKAHNISESLIWQTLYVFDHGIPVLREFLRNGVLKTHKAWKIAHLPKDDQERIAADVKAGKPVELGAVNLRRDRYARLVDAWNACSDDERERFYEAIEREEE